MCIKQWVEGRNLQYNSFTVQKLQAAIIANKMLDWLSLDVTLFFCLFLLSLRAQREEQQRFCWSHRDWPVLHRPAGNHALAPAHELPAHPGGTVAQPALPCRVWPRLSRFSRGHIILTQESQWSKNFHLKLKTQTSLSVLRFQCVIFKGLNHTLDRFSIEWGTLSLCYLCSISLTINIMGRRRS